MPYNLFHQQLSDIYTLSIASDRQLLLHIPINYNETLVKRLHDHPQVKIFNNRSLPLVLPEDTYEDRKSENNMKFINELDTNSNSELDMTT